MLYPRDAPRILLLAAAPASSEGWASSIERCFEFFLTYHKNIHESCNFRSMFIAYDEMIYELLYINS
jgi:hypothetical protein